MNKPIKEIIKDFDESLEPITVAAPSGHAAGDGSLDSLVSWHRGTILTESGDELDAWVLKRNGRTILVAVSPGGGVEPVTKEDRSLIGELLACAS